MTVRLMRIATVFAAFVMFGLPILWVISLSLKSPRDFTMDPLGLSFAPTLDNYRALFANTRFLSFILNSVLVTAGSVALTIALASPVAYAMARLKFTGRRALSLALLLGLTVPVHITLLPLLKWGSAVNLSGTLFGLGLVYAAFGLAITVFVMRAGFAEIPIELFEAAKLDGCGEWRTFVMVALPLARPSLAVAAVYNTVMNYNEFALALTLLMSGKARTLPLGMMDLANEHGPNVPATAAAVTLAVVPVFVLFIVAQRHIISGMTAGAIKG